MDHKIWEWHFQFSNSKFIWFFVITFSMKPTKNGHHVIIEELILATVSFSWYKLNIQKNIFIKGIYVETLQNQFGFKTETGAMRCWISISHTTCWLQSFLGTSLHSLNMNIHKSSLPLSNKQFFSLWVPFAVVDTL